MIVAKQLENVYVSLLKSRFFGCFSVIFEIWTLKLIEKLHQFIVPGQQEIVEAYRRDHGQ